MRTQIPSRLQGAAIDRVAINASALFERDQSNPTYIKYWRIWLHTIDHINGTFLELRDDGSIIRVTTRDGYDERVEIKPKDE